MNTFSFWVFDRASRKSRLLCEGYSSQAMEWFLVHTGYQGEVYNSAGYDVSRHFPKDGDYMPHLAVTETK